MSSLPYAVPSLANVYVLTIGSSDTARPLSPSFVDLGRITVLTFYKGQVSLTTDKLRYDLYLELENPLKRRVALGCTLSRITKAVWEHFRT